jgi:hypothetical protein
VTPEAPKELKSTPSCDGADDPQKEGNAAAFFVDDLAPDEANEQAKYDP